MSVGVVVGVFVGIVVVVLLGMGVEVLMGVVHVFSVVEL